MKKIVKYQAEDGQLFETHVDCERYETVCKVNNILVENSVDYRQFRRIIKSNPKLFKKYCDYHM